MGIGFLQYFSLFMGLRRNRNCLRRISHWGRMVFPRIFRGIYIAGASILGAAVKAPRIRSKNLVRFISINSVLFFARLLLSTVSSWRSYCREKFIILHAQQPINSAITQATLFSGQAYQSVSPIYSAGIYEFM